MTYGASFAQKLIDQGEFEAAIAEATRAHERDGGDPEPLVERAAALASLSRYAEAVRDLEAALALDAEAQVLETDLVDDALFSALLGEARALASTHVDSIEGREATGSGDVASPRRSGSDRREVDTAVERGVARLCDYRGILPRGRHGGDVDLWIRRLRGEGRDQPIVKEHDAG